MQALLNERQAAELMSLSVRSLQRHLTNPLHS